MKDLCAFPPGLQHSPHTAPQQPGAVPLLWEHPIPDGCGPGAPAAPGAEHARRARCCLDVSRCFLCQHAAQREQMRITGKLRDSKVIPISSGKHPARVLSRTYSQAAADMVIWIFSASEVLAHRVCRRKQSTSLEWGQLHGAASPHRVTLPIG